MNGPKYVVLDASVVLKWALPEPGRAEAAALLDDIESARIQPVAPAILPHELGSALARRCRRGDLTEQQAGQAFVLLQSRRPVLVDDEVLSRSAFRLAIEQQLSYWDALYVALAIRLRCDFITADARLRNAAVRHYPYIVSLGE